MGSLGIIAQTIVCVLCAVGAVGTAWSSYALLWIFLFFGDVRQWGALAGSVVMASLSVVGGYGAYLFFPFTITVTP